MDTTPLHRDFGVEIDGIDLKTVTADHLYPQIRAAFDQHSLLLFRGQDWSDDDILRFGQLFGPIENRTDGPVFVPKVSNVRPDGTVAPPDDMQTLNLKANMLWHTDSTFLPTPALTNIITARVVPTEGGTTELVSTRAGLKRLPADLAEAVRTRTFRHRYGHSRRKISEELATQAMFTKWKDQHWRGIWPNPVTGEEAVYVASHVCGIDGMEDVEAENLMERLVAHLTTPDAVYAHQWQVGDVLIWDERATLHRGMPWPFEQPRTLASICVSAGAADGLDAIRAA